MAKRRRRNSLRGTPNEHRGSAFFAFQNAKTYLKTAQGTSKRDCVIRSALAAKALYFAGEADTERRWAAMRSGAVFTLRKSAEKIIRLCSR